ncbi:MAG: Ribonucleoside-diphosphate reductase [candidate division TM6 bacterium GW2011_GWE2_42_60]|nr:MAG: Ribonucleoside-diphosphate reductase [candidate division TM6 bacterium GW2011_GWE2_42_60]
MTSLSSSAQRPAHLPSSNLDTNARVILEKRYLKQDDAGNTCEQPEDLFWRVAWNVAQAEKIHGTEQDVQAYAEHFYTLMADLKFLPNSPCLRGAGRSLQQLFACFVLPIDDSLDSIFDTLKHMAIIHKTGGGTGFSFSRLRANNAPIKSTGGVSKGPISFMRIFDATACEVTQGGVRLGANMGILKVNHPDVEAFIECKADNNSFKHFNISVALDDVFMRAVEEDKEYNLIHPDTGLVAGRRSARAIFDKIVFNAWKNGDPGVIFIDRINESESNMVPALGQIESTNPCGEQPLLPYESCVLGSINLAKFVANKEIIWDELEKTVELAVRFLDDVIDMNHYVVDRIAEMSKGLRRIGLGVMGFADMLIQLEIPYNGQKAVDTAEAIMKFVNDTARKASEKLAEARGAFPYFEKSLYYERNEKPIRNVARTTIAPTGTISTIAGCSSGIEPIFALIHRRKSIWTNEGAKADLLVTYKYFEDALKKEGLYSEELMQKVADAGSVQDLPEIPAHLKSTFITSHSIQPEWHIQIQAAFQRHVNNAVSKTINFPNSATPEDVRKSYVMAYKSGCKGTTIYRDGSRSLQVLTVGSKKIEDKKVVRAAILSDIPENGNQCPECQGQLVASEGCMKCISCGSGRCSI